MDISNSKVTINSKDASNSKEAKNVNFEMKSQKSLLIHKAAMPH
jgi:hypothetical protein